MERGDTRVAPGGEEHGPLVPVIAKPKRPDLRMTAPATETQEAPVTSEETPAIAQPDTPMVREDRPLPDVPFGFTDEREPGAVRAETSASVEDRIEDEASGDAETALSLSKADARQAGDTRPAATPTSGTASRDEPTAPRTERADPYSITATMNEPVSSAEAAQTLAAAAASQTPASAASTQAASTASASPTAMAVPAMLPEASSKSVPEGMVGDDLPLGATMRGETSTDMRPSSSPSRPVTLSGADAVQEIVRAAVVTKGPTTIELRLDPSELGKIDIELSFVDDRVSITVRGEREDALDLMRRSSDELGRMLRQAGLDLDTLSFSRDQAGERGREQALRSFAVDGAGEGAEDGAVQSALRLEPARDRVDIRI